MSDLRRLLTTAANLEDEAEWLPPYFNEVDAKNMRDVASELITLRARVAELEAEIRMSEEELAVDRPDPTPTDGGEMTTTDEDNELPGMLAIAEGVQAQRWPHTIDAATWTKEWMRQIRETPDIYRDEGAMLAWFANAIMAGYDTANARSAARVAELEAGNAELRHSCAKAEVDIDERDIVTDRLEAQIAAHERVCAGAWIPTEHGGHLNAIAIHFDNLFGQVHALDYRGYTTHLLKPELPTSSGEG